MFESRFESAKRGEIRAVASYSAGPAVAGPIFRKEKNGWELNLLVVQLKYSYFVVLSEYEKFFYNEHFVIYGTLYYAILCTASSNFHVENGSSAIGSSVSPVEIV